MTVGAPDWPRKTREVRLAQMDSRVWNGFPFRDDDIVIATYAKAGTTWMQQIVAELVLGGSAGDLSVNAISPWLDSRTQPFPERLALLEAQTHRRFVKTHLPLDALVFSPRARYIYLARDGRDVVWSMHNHHLQLKDIVYELFNRDLEPGIAPFDRPDLEIVPYFRRWMDRNGHPWWPFWENVRTWWAVRHLPNVLVVHFNDLKRDLSGEIGRIADFLGVSLDQRRLDAVTVHCSFEYMQANAERFAPRAGSQLEGGARSFIHKGTNGRWRELLAPGDIARYETLASNELGPDCARWLAEGGKAG